MQLAQTQFIGEMHCFAKGHLDANTNGEGGIDGSDVEVFFIQWQNGVGG